MDIKKRNRTKKYKYDRNILRNNIAKKFSYCIYVGSFQAHCILSRYYKALNEYNEQQHA